MFNGSLISLLLLLLLLYYYYYYYYYYVICFIKTQYDIIVIMLKCWQSSAFVYLICFDQLYKNIHHYRSWQNMIIFILFTRTHHWRVHDMWQFVLAIIAQLSILPEACNAINIYSYWLQWAVKHPALGAKVYRFNPSNRMTFFQILISRLTTSWVGDHVNWRCHLHWIIKNKGGC